MDNESFWKLLEPVHPAASGFCRKLVGGADGGDDLYQDALLAAMRKFDSLADRDAFRPWLFRIIVNAFKNRCRRPWRKRRVDLTPELVERSASDPRGELDARRVLARALAALTPEDRALTVLHEIEGWTVPEMAEMYQKPEGTVKTRLHRARGKMRRALLSPLPQPATKPCVSEGVLCAAKKPSEG